MSKSIPLTAEQKKSRTDLYILFFATLIPVVIYVALESTIMNWAKTDSNPLFIRFLPVICIQFGLAGLGMAIVMIRNRESFKSYGLILKNAVSTCIYSLLISIPMIAVMFAFGEIHRYLPFGGFFLTDEILKSAFPQNIILYILIALEWGFIEGFNYVVICNKVNARYPSKNIFLNKGAITCGILCILIHGMIGINLQTILEAITTFILIYGMLLIKDKNNNAWGCVIIFFLVWNAF